MANIKFINVSKRYDENTAAVKNASFEIHDKEFVVLVGPSGCGKTTSLRMIAGLEELSEGEIIIDDKVVNNVPSKDRDIAMVFQNYALYPHMTVFENMAFGLKLRKFDKKEIEQRVNETAKILELEKYLNRKPKALSGGQRQRVALGRAIVRKPKVFLFDEPLSNLDAKLRVHMRTEISKLHKALEATIVYVTHDQVEAMTMGSKIVVMKEGIIQQIGSPMNLYNQPENKFVAGFIGSPAMNFIKGSITNSLEFISDRQNLKFDLPDEERNRFLGFVNKEVILGIRPEDVSADKDLQNKIKFVSNVELVEPMGNESFIYVRIDNVSWISRSYMAKLPEIGIELTFYLNPKKLYFFDSSGNQSVI